MRCSTPTRPPGSSCSDPRQPPPWPHRCPYTHTPRLSSRWVCTGAHTRTNTHTHTHTQVEFQVGVRACVLVCVPVGGCACVWVDGCGYHRAGNGMTKGGLGCRAIMPCHCAPLPPPPPMLPPPPPLDVLPCLSCILCLLPCTPLPLRSACPYYVALMMSTGPPSSPPPFLPHVGCSACPCP